MVGSWIRSNEIRNAPYGSRGGTSPSSGVRQGLCGAVDRRGEVAKANPWEPFERGCSRHGPPTDLGAPASWTIAPRCGAAVFSRGPASSLLQYVGTNNTGPKPAYRDDQNKSGERGGHTRLSGGHIRRRDEPPRRGRRQQRRSLLSEEGVPSCPSRKAGGKSLSGRRQPPR